MNLTREELEYVRMLLETREELGDQIATEILAKLPPDTRPKNKCLQCAYDRSKHRMGDCPVKSYITYYKSIGGWKAVHVWWNPDMGGFYEPWETGAGAYDEPESAEAEAMAWAEDEGLEYRAPHVEGKLS
jgi:hypothetical protein